MEGGKVKTEHSIYYLTWINEARLFEPGGIGLLKGAGRGKSDLEPRDFIAQPTIPERLKYDFHFPEGAIEVGAMALNERRSPSLTH